MKVLSTRFQGLKLIRGKNFYDKKGYFREILKKNLLKKKNLYFGVYLNPKKMFLEDFIYKQNLNKLNLFRY